MSYYAHTHKADRIANKDLFRLNRISFDEMLENLTILLDDDGSSGSATMANLPTNADVIKSFRNPTGETPTEYPVAKINDLCVVVWQETNGYQWYLGYIKKLLSNAKLSVDHLVRTTSDSKWKYPSQEDLQEAGPEQIVQCEVNGDWDMSADSRKRRFSITNVKAISCAFQRHIGNCDK